MKSSAPVKTLLYRNITIEMMLRVMNSDEKFRSRAEFFNRVISNLPLRYKKSPGDRKFLMSEYIANMVESKHIKRDGGNLKINASGIEYMKELKSFIKKNDHLIK